MDRVKPERNPGAAKPPVGEGRDEDPARKGFHHGTAVYGPVCTVVWEGRSREASPYPDFWAMDPKRPKWGMAWEGTALFLAASTEEAGEKALPFADPLGHPSNKRNCSRLKRDFVISQTLTK